MYYSIQKNRVLFLALLLIFSSCETEEDDELLNDNGNNPVNCNFTTYNGATDCGPSFVAVTDEDCCPSDFPYWKVNSNSCYATCEDAVNDGATQIIKGDNGTGGGNGGGSGSGATTGELSFWTQSDLGCGNINVNVSGYGSSVVTSYYANGFPGCGANGNANFTLPQGNYNYTANCNGTSSSGTISVYNGECSNVQLTGSGGGGGGGSGNGCDWTRGVNLVSVTGEFGTRCGNPNSVEMLVTNNSNIKLRTFICIRRADGSYSGFGDVNGLDPGESFGGFVCDGNGEYIIYAEYWDIYEANGYCNYGGCP